MVKGGSNGFALKGGDATQGGLKTMWDGARPNGYQPMKKQGSIILCVPSPLMRSQTHIPQSPAPRLHHSPPFTPSHYLFLTCSGIGGDNSDRAM